MNHRSIYRMFAFDLRYEKDRMGAEAKHPNFKFALANDDNLCLEIVLTRKIISVNSDVSKIFDILS